MHEEHSEPEESPGNSKVVGEMLFFLNFWFTKSLSNLFLLGTAFQYSVFSISVQL